MEEKRLLNIQNGQNFRDLGGYQAIDCHYTKWHRLVRSGSLANLNQKDLTILEKIPITLDLDFRAPEEVHRSQDHVPTTAQYHHLPVFTSDETDASHSDQEIADRMAQPGNGYRHMLDVYRRMVTVPTAKNAYQQMFQLLMENDHGATLFHCTAGKDRTGMGAFLILSALQVPLETIKQDYLLTNSATRDFRHRWLDMLRAEGESETVVQNRHDLGSVSIDYLNEALKIIEKNYGDVDHYLTDYLQLSKGDLATLRHQYLE